jgi:hypothetical protein
LLTFAGRKSYWEDPASKDKLGFEDVVERLKRQARKIESERDYQLRIAVFGLDLRDPPLS